MKLNKSHTERASRGRVRDEALFPVAPAKTNLPKNYGLFLAEIKKRIGTERVKTVLAVNAAMIFLYWDIGRSILQNQKAEGWGAKVIERMGVCRSLAGQVNCAAARCTNTLVS